MQDFLKNIAQHGKTLANKNLGQNFLKDQNIINRITTSADIKKKPVVEIGSGLGSLTYAILQQTNEYIAIEKDLALVELLKNYFPKATFIHADALQFDFNRIITPNTIIISNLPYNVGTKIIVKLGTEVLSKIDSMLIMLQKEVINKITGKFESKNYHHLGIFFQSFCNIEHICNVPPSAFSPAPNVMSSVIKICPQKHDIPLQKFWNFIQTAHCFPRKTMGSIFPNCTERYQSKRPQQINPQEWLEIFLENFI